MYILLEITILITAGNQLIQYNGKLERNFWNCSGSSRCCCGRGRCSFVCGERVCVCVSHISYVVALYIAVIILL